MLPSTSLESNARSAVGLHLNLMLYCNIDDLCFFFSSLFPTHILVHLVGNRKRSQTLPLATSSCAVAKATWRSAQTLPSTQRKRLQIPSTIQTSACLLVKMSWRIHRYVHPLHHTCGSCSSYESSMKARNTLRLIVMRRTAPSRHNLSLIRCCIGARAHTYIKPFSPWMADTCCNIYWSSKGTRS